MLKKRNREIIKNIKKIMHGMENRGYEIESIAIDTSGNNKNEAIPYLYINSDAVKNLIEEHFKEEKESWKYAYLNQLLENVENQAIVLCGAHLRNSDDAVSKKFLNQFEIKYEKEDEDIIKLHFLFDKLFQDISKFFDDTNEEPKTD